MTEPTGTFADVFSNAARADWTRGQNALWLPTRNSYTLSTVPNFGPRQLRPGIRAQRYMTATQVFGLQIPADLMARHLDETIAADILIFVASILTRQEAYPDDLQELDNDWAAAMFGASALPKVQSQITSGARLLAPQLLFGAAKLALISAQPGPPTDDGEGIRTLALSILALGDAYGADYRSGEMLGPWPVSLALELTSNLHFNSWDKIPILIGRFQAMWRTLGSALANDRGQPTPEDRFAKATGVQWIDAASFCIAVHAEVLSSGAVRFPQDFFQHFGIDESAADRILAAISRPRSVLADEVQKEFSAHGPDWSLNTLRRFPLIDLEDGTFVVLSLRLLYERLFGIPFFLEIQQDLRTNDPQSVAAFEQLHADIIEQSAVASAQSLAPATAAGDRVYVEDQMQAAWPGKRGQTTSVCDVVIDYGHTWACFEVISSRLSERAASGTDLDALLEDIAKIITRRKAAQLASTISNLKKRESALTGHAASSERTFLPVLVTGYHFPVNPALMSHVRDVLAGYGLLQPPIKPLVIMSLTELEYLEALTERGHAAADVLLQWADSDMRDGPLDNYLTEHGYGLFQPNRFDQPRAELTDEFVARVAAVIGADDAAPDPDQDGRPPAIGSAS